MNETNRNMIIAIVLSVVVLFGWQLFIAGPQAQRAQQQAEIAAQQAAAACCAAISCACCARCICGPAMKNCHPNSTTTLSTMARIMLRLVSFMVFGFRDHALWRALCRWRKKGR